MFLKRLSIALCATMCFGTLLFGASPESSDNARPVEEENIWMAPEAIPDFYLTYISPKCNGNSDGSIIVNITTGTGPFKIEYRPSSTSSFITEERSASGPTIPINGLSAGFYDVRVTDLNLTTNNSDIEEDFEVEEFSVLNLSAQIDPINCATETGKITLIASGGDDSNYTYTLENSSGTPISPYVSGGKEYSNLSEDTYIATVIDGNGCPETKSSGLSVNIPEPISPNVIEGTIDCPGGTATIELTNLPSDASSYQIKLDGTTPPVNISGTTAIISNVSAGLHNLTIERPNCSSDDWPSSGSHTVDIEDYEPIDFSWATNPVTDNISVDCYDEETTLTVTLTGGQSGKTVELILKNRITLNETTLNSSLPINQPFDFDIKKGEYSLIARISSCSYEKPEDFNIDGPSVPFEITSLDKTDVTCPGGSGGIIEVNYSGGTGVIEYAYNGGSYQDLPSDRTISGLGGGEYSIVLRHSSVCETDPAIESIEVPNEINVSLDVTQQLSCPGGDNGILTATTSEGGNGGYRYTLYDSDGIVVPGYNDIPGSGTHQFTGLTAGIYEVDVHTVGCSDNKTDQAEILQIDAISIEVDYEPVLCNNIQVGDFNVKATGGDGSLFTYALRESGGTVHSESPKTETASGSGVTFHNLEPDKTYRVEASYGTCTPVVDNITIKNPLPLFVNYQPLIKLDCHNGDTDFEISASGESPFEISEDGINYIPFNNSTENKHTLTGKTEGIYTYYIKDANGCEYNEGTPVTINVSQPDEIFVNVVTPNPRIKCFNEADAEVQLEITGGYSPYTVEIIGSGRPAKSPDVNGFVTFTKLPAGEDYDVRVIDNSGCDVTRGSVFDIASLTAPLEVTTTVDKTMLDCYGDETTIAVDFEGGWSSTSYTVNVSGINADGNIDEDLTAPNYSSYLKKGTYTITVTDNINGCEATEEIIIEQPPQFKITGNVTHEDVSCDGENDASITFEVTGGTQPYYWGIDDTPSNEFTTDSYTITDSDYELSAGTYTLYLADENGCSIEGEEVEIEEPEPITFDPLYDEYVSCYGAEDGSITIDDPQGSWSSDYLVWITPDGGSEFQGNYPTTIDLLANTYRVRLSNKEETCFSDYQEITIKEPTPLSFQKNDFIKEHLKCYNVFEGKIVVKALGGLPFNLEYRIANGSGYDSGFRTSNVFIELPSGFYDVWVRLEGNDECMLQYSEEYDEKIEIQNPEELIIDTTIVVGFKCRDDINRGSVEIIAEGGKGVKNYYLSDAPGRIVNNPNTTGKFSDLGEFGQDVTTYHYYVTDENGCQTEEQSFNIINPPKLEILSWEKNDALCNNDKNGSIDLMITGGTVESAYTITDLLKPGLEYNIEQKTDNNYILKGLGSSDPNGAEYQPVITDDNNCVVQVVNPILIENPEQVEYTVSIDSALCHGDTDDKIIIHAKGGTGSFYYSLDGDKNYGDLHDSIFVDEPEGLKMPYVKDENKCRASDIQDEFEYKEPKSFEVRFTEQGIKCYEDEFGNVVLDLSGGTGNYYLSVNDKDFESTDDFLNPYEIQRSSRDTTPYDLLENSIHLPEDITFELFLKDENGCYVQNIEAVNTIQKPVLTTKFERPDPLILIDAPTPYPVTCAGDQSGRIRFNAKGGAPDYNYIFTVTKTENPYINYTNKTEVEASEEGTFGEVKKLFSGKYTYTLTNENNCQAYFEDTDEILESKDIEIEATYDAISIGYEISEDPICDSKSNGALKIDIYNYMDLGVHVKLEKLNNGIGSYETHKKDTLTLYADDEGVIVNNAGNPETFETYDLLDTLLADRMGIGMYQIVAQDNRSTCTDTVSFGLLSQLGPNCPPEEYNNWFSPHSGNNDISEWEIYDTEYEKYLLQIYTSYGELVYSTKGNSDDDNIKWDGLDDKGKPVPGGTYIYLLQKSNGVRDTIINGNVSVIRNVYK
jgi:hypothetical protein